MAEKEFTLKVIKSEPTPRRRRVAPGANGDAMNRVSTGSQVSGSGNAGSAQGDGHVHANKGALDKIGVTDDGYVTITDMPDAETVTEKAKAGYADTAGTAEEAKTLTEDSEVWEMFVSRLKDDVVKGNISFEKAIAVAGVATLAGGLKIGGYGIDKSGKATLAEVVATLMKATSAEAGRLKVTEAAEIVLSLLKSADFVSGATGAGVAIYKNGSSWKMEIDELLVRKIATFLKLEIRELSYVGGNIVLSKAGNEITAVEKVGGGWKCLFTANDGDEVQNFWKAGDQARCQKFDVAEGTNESVQSKYYWRLVTEVGEDYVVLSETDYDEGVTNSEPAAGDKIVQMGFRLSGDEEDKDRTSLIILSTSGENTPSIEAYTGVVGYELSAEKRLFILSPGEVSFRSDMFRWMSGGVKFPQEIYKGDWQSGEHYDYYNKVTWNGSTWICVAPGGTSSEPAKGNAAWKEYAEKGADGTAGKGIKSITEYYLATSAGSGVTTGTSGWTTAVQTITAAKRFLWNYEATAYTDGSSTKSSPVIIGVYGEKGEAGTSVKVSSTMITYAAGTSGTTPPSSGWSEKVTAVSAGQYLWSKTVVTYSDGKSTTTYSVSYQGTNGSPGEPGTSVTITGQATKYAVTTTAGQPADSAFTSDKIPALSPGDYLWSRTTVTYSSGVQTKSYAVSRIGTDGTDGQPGSDGKNSYTHFAYASSADGATGFSTTYFEGALYLGTCSDFNEADPEDYRAYTWARMKGETGAGYSPNLIIGTKEMDGWNWGGSSWNIKQEIVKEADGGSYIKQTVTVTPASADPADNIQSYVWVRRGDTAEYKHMEKYPYELFTPGRKYTLSFEYKSDVPVRVQISVRGTGLVNKVPVELTVFPASAEWTRVSASGTCPGGINNEGYKKCLLTACIGSSQAGSDVAAGDTAYFRNFCLVEGEGTQWIPAVSEMVGVDGVSVTAVKNMYKAGTSSTKAPEGTYVADVMQAGFSETNKYLWGYEINTLSDGKTIETTKHLVSVWGQTGAAGKDAYTVLLTNEAHTFEGGETAAKAAVTSFLVQAYKGAEMVRATIGEITGIPSGMTVQLSENGSTTPSATITVTEGMDKLSGSLDVPITVDGKVFKKRFSWSVALQGDKGDTGEAGTDAKRNLLMNSGEEKAAAAGKYNIAYYYVSPAEGVRGAGHTGSLVEGEKYTVVMCFTPKSANTQTLRLYANSNSLWVNFGVPKSGKNIYKATFTCSYNAGYGPDGTTDILVRLYYGNSGVASSFLGGTVHWIKIVRGEAATDEWTPAPEDSNNFDVQVSPAALSLKTDEDDGSVIYSGNTATLTATHGGQPAKVSLVSGSKVLTGLTGFGTGGSGTEAMTVALTGVNYTVQELKVPNGTGYDTKQMQIPVTSGQAAFKVKLDYAGYREERTITVPFTVDVKASFVSFGKTANSIVGQVWDTNGVVSRLSKVEQTADSITSTVESMPLGGPNLLPHSMWRAVVRSEAGNTWVKLKKGVKYTLSARACAEEGKDLFVSAYAVQSSGQWGRSNAIRFTEAAFAEKSLTFVLEDKDGFTYNDEVRVLVYAVNIVKGTASATEGKGAVVWVQLEEGPGASAWQAQAGDYEERPSLLKAGDRDLTTTATETETVLEDGTTGTVLYHKMTALEVAVGFADVVRFKANTLTFAEPDTQYTISVWAKGTGRIKMYMTANTLGSITQDGAKRIDTDGETEYMELGSTWKRYEATITTDKTVAKNGRVYPLRLFDSGSEVWCYGWKVEKGGMATGGGGASVKYEKELHEYKSDIQQLSDEINLTVKKDDIETAGIHLDGENSTITLRGDRTIIDGDEFNANNATFRNLTVAGNLRTSVVQQPYANDNIFVGKDGDGSLGWMFVHDSGQPSSAKSYVFMPPDPDFIGSRVILHACSAQDSSGTHIATHGMYVLGGRTFCKHAYLEANAGTYYLSRVNAGTGGIRSVAQSVLTGADYFSGKRASVSGGGYYVPNALNNLVGATVELIGAPAFSASAILCPYVVRLGDDMLYNREAPPYVLVDEPLVTDPLHAKLKALYDKGGAGAITDLGVGYGVITGATMKYHYSSADSGLMRTKTGLVLFKVPLCQWFISIYNAVSGTFSRASVGTTWENEEWN